MRVTANLLVALEALQRTSRVTESAPQYACGAIVVVLPADT